MGSKIDPSSTIRNKLPENIFCPQFGKEEQKHLHPPFPFPYQNTPDFPRPQHFSSFSLFTLMGQIRSEPPLFLSPSNKNKKADPISIFPPLTLIRVQEHLLSEVLHWEPGGRHRRWSETVFASGKRGASPATFLQKQVAVARSEGHVRLVGADGFGAGLPPPWREQGLLQLVVAGDPAVWVCAGGPPHDQGLDLEQGRGGGRRGCHRRGRGRSPRLSWSPAGGGRLVSLGSVGAAVGRRRRLGRESGWCRPVATVVARLGTAHV